ncbi:MAG TPA: hypothetical protein VG370_28865 [Chloroflexota bacterium]|nr:hypothetical protein [Chloroflexota bacterium]
MPSPETLGVTGTALLLILLLVIFGLNQIPNWGRPEPTPAILALRTTYLSDRASPPAIIVPPPLLAGSGPQDRQRVRLRHEVLVRTRPSADSERPAIAMLGVGTIAEVVERRDDWFLIEFGPLSGWAQLESVEFVL